MEQDHDARILFLFRHGETDWNREGRLQGHTDTALNDTGLAQAKALGETLRIHRLDGPRRTRALALLRLALPGESGRRLQLPVEPE